LLEIRPDAVDVLHARQDRHIRVGVVAEADPGVREHAEMVDVEGVPRLGAVDRDRDDVAVLRVVDRHGGFAYTEAVAARHSRRRSAHAWRSSSSTTIAA